MGRIVAVTNLKGGIGKTTTVVNIGAGLALKGARVLLVDVDAQGNLALALGVHPRRTLYEVLVDGAQAANCVTPARPNLDLLAGDESLLAAQPTIARRSDWPRVLEQSLRSIRAHYDFVFIDCGGSLTVLNTNALNAASDVLVPTTVETFSMKGLEMLVKQIVRFKNSTSCIRMIIPTMFDPRLRQSAALLAQLQQTYGSLVAPPVRVNVRLSEASAEGKTIYEYDPRSRGAVDYANLVERLSTAMQFSPTPAMVSNGQHPAPPPIVADLTEAVQPVITPSEPLAASITTERAHIHGSGAPFNLTCPVCGHDLRRTTVAGYRVVYCNHCKYKQQELASGFRR